ncbi:MAG: hypothetical protein RL110_1631, partial [Bacteroidota bacterium]
RWERDYLRWSPLHRCEASARTLRFLIPLILHFVAVGAGFEPAVQLPVRQFSKLLVSATHPSHLVDWTAKIGNPFGILKKKGKKGLRNKYTFRAVRL